jgi:ectoine hydroxylase-related dioxygenase (phytanoyl-CoA dioxygenase family)
MSQKMPMPTPMEDYLFDLRGYTVLRNAVDPAHVAEMNAILDTVPPLEMNDWWGNVQRKDDNRDAGCELHNIFEAGEPFERLIDHPAWVDHLRHWCGDEGCYVEGLFIDECMANIRRSGGFFGCHSGGWQCAHRTRYSVEHGKFRCGQVNVIVALTDVGPGDGGTCIIPGSHKSNFEHPDLIQHPPFGQRVPMDQLEGTVEMHYKAGDALVFSDAVTHGANPRTNPGERRVIIMRYGPMWGARAFGYAYSQELLDRLTPERRKILEPLPPRRPRAKVLA